MAGGADERNANSAVDIVGDRAMVETTFLLGIEQGVGGPFWHGVPDYLYSFDYSSIDFYAYHLKVLLLYVLSFAAMYYY
mgnify:CR=1 FL=1